MLKRCSILYKKGGNDSILLQCAHLQSCSALGSRSVPLRCRTATTTSTPHTRRDWRERERPDNARGVRAHTSARCRAPAGLRWGRARFVRTRVPDLETPPNDVRRQRAEGEAAQDPDTARERARPLLRPPAHVPPPHLFTHGPSMPRPRSPHPHRPAAGPRR